MKKMLLLFNHDLTTLQIEDARQSLGVGEFIQPPEELQRLFLDVKPEIESLVSYLIPIQEFVKQNSKKGDYILIQGDFGVTYIMVKFSKKLGLIPLYATTKRESFEVKDGDKIVKKSTFKHVRFRKYEDT